MCGLAVGGIVLPGWWSAARAGGPGNCFEWIDTVTGPACSFGSRQIYARGINNDGVVVGHSHCSVAPPRAYRWQSGTPLQEIVIPGATDSMALFINNRGTIAGEASIPGIGWGYVAWILKDGVLTIITPPLPLGHGPGAFTDPQALNDQDQLLVYFAYDLDGSSSRRTLLWQDGVLTDIGDLLGISGPAVGGTYISRDGRTLAGWTGQQWQICHPWVAHDGRAVEYPGIEGRSMTAIIGGSDDGEFLLSVKDLPAVSPYQSYRARFRDGEAVYERIAPLSGYTGLRSWTMTSDGMVFGQSTGGPYPFQTMYTAVAPESLQGQAIVTQMLNADWSGYPPIVPPGLPSGGRPGWSDNGLLASSRHVHRRVPPPPGDLDGDCRVGLADLLRLLAMWGSDQGEGDLNENGAVDAADLMILLEHWYEGPVF
ncbi:MAG: hypothetical protein KF817_04925 [Phycisphaeraceae bacterium]|nr:hypothetical protein [Phycisphaeraceae bacterium]